jgi:hypothetical protein
VNSNSNPESTWHPGMSGYFDNVWQSYRGAVNDQQYSVAIDRGLDLFESYRSASPTTFSTEHKGSPMYVLGYAAYASRNYSSASLFFDAAVAEDLRKFGAGADKPALLFMRLEDKDQEVLASQIVRDIIQVAEELIANYVARPGHVMVTLGEVRTHFLKPLIASPDVHKRALITAFISFMAEWKCNARLIDLIENGSREPFFLHLFRGCLLFESLLKECGRRPNPNRAVLSQMWKLYEAELGISGITINQSSDDIDLKIRGASSGSSLFEAMQITAQVRNTFGHNIVWEVPALDAQTYNVLVENIASACLHAISTLYR